MSVWDGSNKGPASTVFYMRKAQVFIRVGTMRSLSEAGGEHMGVVSETAGLKSWGCRGN